MESVLKMRESKEGTALITLGPTIDRGLDPTHYRFSSGARLSFAIDVKSDGSSGRLLGYRFDVRHDGSPFLPVLRFELRQTSHNSPLEEPQAHLHLGSEDLRIPTRIVDPFEVLDLIFFVIAPKLQGLDSA